MCTMLSDPKSILRYWLAKSVHVVIEVLQGHRQGGGGGLLFKPGVAQAQISCNIVLVSKLHGALPFETNHHLGPSIWSLCLQLC